MDTAVLSSPLKLSDDEETEWGFHPMPRLNSEEDENDVCEAVLDKFIHRIILSASLKDKEDRPPLGKAVAGNEGSVPVAYEPINFNRKPRVNGEKALERYDKKQNRSKSNRPRRETRRDKKSKNEKENKEDMPRGTVKQVDGMPFVHVPLEVYKKMVESEIDGKLKQMQDYYEYNNRRLEELHLDAMKEAIFWKDYANRTEIKLSLCHAEYQKLNDRFERARIQLLRYEERDSLKKFLPIPHQQIHRVKVKRKDRGKAKDKENEKKIEKDEPYVRDMSCGDNVALEL